MKYVTLYQQLEIVCVLVILKSMAIFQRINFVLVNIFLAFWSKNESFLIDRFLNLPLPYFMCVMN